MTDTTPEYKLVRLYCPKCDRTRENWRPVSVVAELDYNDEQQAFVFEHPFNCVNLDPLRPIEKLPRGSGPDPVEQRRHGGAHPASAAAIALRGAA